MPRGIAAPWCSTFQPTVNGKKTFWIAAKNVKDADGNKKKIRGRGATPAAAEARLGILYSDWVVNGSRPRKPRAAVQSAEKMLFKEAFHQWHERIDPTSVSDIVRHKYLRAGELHVLPAFGDKALVDITREDIQDFLWKTLPNKTKTDGTPLLAASGQANIFKVVHQVVTWGLRKGIITVDPTAGIKRPKHKSKFENVGMFAGQAVSLMKHLDEDNDPNYARYLFQYLGLRQSERLGLEWSCITNLNNSRGTPSLMIRQQLASYQKGGYYIKQKPKTVESERKIPIPEPFLSALRKHKKQQDAWKKADSWNPKPEFKNLVFLRENGKLITTNNDTADWHKILKKYKYPDWRGHLNRKITATLLTHQNPPIPIAIVRQILGHSTEAMSWYYTETNRDNMVAPLDSYGETFQ